MKIARLPLAVLVLALALSSVGIASGTGSYLFVNKATVGVGGVAANGNSWGSSISRSGRFVALRSDAGNLILSDSGAGVHSFLYDSADGGIERVSVSSQGEPGNAMSDTQVVSADGGCVAFCSAATNLVPFDTNATFDVFVRDTDTGTTVRASVSSDEQQAQGYCWGPSISANGRYVAFYSYADNLVGTDGWVGADVFVRNLWSGNTEIISRTFGGGSPNGESSSPSISADGRYVAFKSFASDIVSGDTNNSGDVFVRDRWTGTNERVSVSSAEVPGNAGGLVPKAITPDGRFVMFESESTNLVADDTNGRIDVFVRDRMAGTTERVSLSSAEVESTGNSWGAGLSDDGRWAIFETDGPGLAAADTNDDRDVFVRDRQTGTTRLVSVKPNGQVGADDSGWGSVSSNGRTFALASQNELAGEPADAMTDIYRRRLVDYDTAYSSISGADRYATAVAASKAAFPTGARFVVIATGTNWPDALGGGALAASVGAPILLTKPGELPSSVVAEIARLQPEIAYVLGGKAAVGDAVYKALQKKVGSEDVIRIGGNDRFETAEKIAEETVRVLGSGFDGTCILATGDNFPDALAASPLAAAKGWPVLLCPSSGLRSSTRGKMAALGTKEVLILGANNVVPSSAESVLNDTYAVHRAKGSDRYGTAAAIAAYGVANAGLVWDDVAIATGQNFPDALAGGVLQGKDVSLMLLTPTGSLAPAARNALITNALSIDDVRFLGGDSAVSTTVRNQVKAAVAH